MNERIRELAKHAGIYYYRKGKLQVDTENLVELVVRECKGVLFEMINNKHGEFDTLDQALTEINEHFGVEDV
jgi:hypothetical protein